MNVKYEPHKIYLSTKIASIKKRF